jgi:broad specificity phosphatase PhoE
MCLILIRHSISRQDPQVSAHQWSLTDEGRARCAALARRIHPYQPAIIVSSEEPKALQTAQAVTELLKLPHETGLHEQLRETEPYRPQTEFEARIRKLMENPLRLVFGEETGDAAYQRFQAAIDAIFPDTRIRTSRR